MTSNRPVEGWGKLLGDAAAVSPSADGLDRLLHQGHVLKCGPGSWRTKTDLPAEPSAGEKKPRPPRRLFPPVAQPVGLQQAVKLLPFDGHLISQSTGLALCPWQILPNA
jgi:hypothetical protein